MAGCVPCGQTGDGREAGRVTGGVYRPMVTPVCGLRSALWPVVAGPAAWVRSHQSLAPGEGARAAALRRHRGHLRAHGQRVHAPVLETLVSGAAGRARPRTGAAAAAAWARAATRRVTAGRRSSPGKGDAGLSVAQLRAELRDGSAATGGALCADRTCCGSLRGPASERGAPCRERPLLARHRRSVRRGRFCRVILLDRDAADGVGEPAQRLRLTNAPVGQLYRQCTVTDIGNRAGL